MHISPIQNNVNCVDNTVLVVTNKVLKIIGDNPTIYFLSYMVRIVKFEQC